MTLDEISREMDRARAAGLSEAALGVLRERLGVPEAALEHARAAAGMQGSQQDAAPAVPAPAPVSAPVSAAEPQAQGPSYADRVAQRAGQLEAYVADKPVLGTARILAGSLASGLDSATAGYSTKALGALLPGSSPEKAGIEVAAARKAWPGATMVSDIAGLVYSPLGRALGATGGFAAGATGATRLAEAAATRPFLVRAAANTLQNLVSGSAGIGALEMMKSRPDIEGMGLGERLRSAISAATSPENVALSGALGTFVAKLQVMPSPQASRLRPLMERWERLTGRRPNDAILTDDAARHSFLDSASRTPELADAARQVREESINGMRALGQEIAARNGGRPSPLASESEAASAVRRVTGSPAGQRAGENIVTTERRTMERPIFTRFTRQEVDPDLSDSLFRSARILRDGRPKSETAPELDRIIGRLRDGLKDAPLYGRDLEGIRKQLGKIAYDFNMADPEAAGWTERGRWEAAQLYNVVNRLIETANPQARNALRTAAGLRAAESALADVPTSTIDRAAIDAFWTHRDVMTNLDTVMRHGLPDDLNSLRGDYVWRMIHAVTNPETGLVNGKKLREITQERGGMFNHQISDRIVPGLAGQLRDLAQLSEIVGKGAVRAEGSPTARAGLQITKMVAAPVAAAATLLGMLTNPFHTGATILTAGVAKSALIAARRSLLVGAGQDMLGAMAMGQPPPAFTLPQVAATETGGLSRGIEAGVSGLSSAAEMASPALDWASRSLTNAPQEQTEGKP